MAEGRKTGAERGRGRTTRRAAPFRDAPSDLPVITPEPCRFLARYDADGMVREATATVDPRHVCVALVDPVPQSGRQQELVCLTSAHVNCPRYLRGLLIANAPAPPATRRREQISPAVIGATLLLLAAIAASFGFLAVRGGFELALASPTPFEVGAIPSAVSSPAESGGEGASASVDAVSPSALPSPSAPTASSSPAPTLEPTPTPAATATPTPAPTSDRFALLTKCPSTADCWIYTIRSGDNLRSIANYFGVSYDRVLAMNPNLRRPIHAGDKLRIPTPTR